MRLNEEEIAAIKLAARQAFGKSAVVRLFGSRVHDHLRGGDIDLHFEVDPGYDSESAIRRFEDILFQSMDEQRVDKVFTVRGRPHGPFELIGYRDGIVL